MFLPRLSFLSLPILASLLFIGVFSLTLRVTPECQGAFHTERNKAVFARSVLCDEAISYLAKAETASRRALAATSSFFVALAASLDSGGPDTFGYTWDTDLTYSWITLTVPYSNTGLIKGADDVYTGTIPIGFEFKFYENVYDEIYISTNGLSSFWEGTDTPNNKSIPRVGMPDDFIAPFWGDLKLKEDSSGIYYDYGMIDSTQYMVIEWRDISLYTQPGLLSFQAILYETGKICYQYKQMAGDPDSASVGIEDQDGVDGLLYLYNEAGIETLVGSQQLCFHRPGPEGRVKALPLYQSGFTRQGQADFQVALHNTGEVVTDTFDITKVVTGSGWTASLYQENGVTPLTDTDQDGIPDSGTIDQGEGFTLTVKLNSPVTAGTGDYAQVLLTARSSETISRSASVSLQAAIPANFAQALADDQSGLNLQLVEPRWQTLRWVAGDFTGSTLSLEDTSDGGYVYAWEDIVGDDADIEYVLLDNYGEAVRPVTKLTDNFTPTLSVVDRSPVLAASPGGNIGVSWVRNIVSTTEIITTALNSNVYLVILNDDGDMLHGPLNVTNNTAWRGAGYSDIPFFESPRIASTGDDRFVLAWQDDRLKIEGNTSDIYYAIYGSEGSLVFPPTAYTLAEPGVAVYKIPTLAEINTDQVLLAYTTGYSVTPASQAYTITYAVLDSAGVSLRPSSPITDSDGLRVDAAQLGGGKIVLAWTNMDNNHIMAAILDEDDYSLQGLPISLDNPFDRQANYVSVASDKENHAVLTWMDDEENDYLYYTLVADDGELVTPPMIFYSGTGDYPRVRSSLVGQGIAPHRSGSIFLPLILR